jgi:basic amino acid/polyamine antiporter, APA family
MNHSVKKIDLVTCVSIIVSSMIGVGVYTSLGYQVLGLSSVFAILALWFLGGVMALCGALTYGELASRYPRSGGEYNFLSEIYHPAIGFISGWISSTVGFAGPTAAAALVFANYFNKIMGLDMSNPVTATLLIVFITLLNILSFNLGSSIQKIITIVNILLICVIILFGIFHAPSQDFSFTMGKEDLMQITTDSFGISLVYVSFAFSGWNAITYIINDVSNPKVNVPRSLIIASALVMVLYMGLNFVFLYTTPIGMLKSELCDGCTGYIAGTQIFGELGGKIIAGIICIALFASINSYTLAGPRVIKTIGEDFKSIKKLARINDHGSPVLATMIQAGLAILICWVSKFQSIIEYLGLTLSILTTLTVFGVFVSRYKQRHTQLEYKTLGYPVVPIIFIMIELFMIYKIIQMKPIESLWMLATVASGLLIYYFLENKTESNGKNRDVEIVDRD